MVILSIDEVFGNLLARPDGKLDLSNPYTWAKSPEMLKKMGYDENGMVSLISTKA